MLQRSYPLFETGAMIPELIGKGRIALDRLPTAGTFFVLERLAELLHPFSSRGLSLRPRPTETREGCAQGGSPSWKLLRCRRSACCPSSGNGAANQAEGSPPRRGRARQG